MSIVENVFVSWCFRPVQSAFPKIHTEMTWMEAGSVEKNEDSKIK